MVSDQVVSVKFTQRELDLLIGPLDDWIKEMGEPDPDVGMVDPDREPELQQLRDLHSKLYAALISTQIGKSEHPDVKLP